jgi:hypothetical protein
METLTEFAAPLNFRLSFADFCSCSVRNYNGAKGIGAPLVSAQYKIDVLDWCA